MIQWHQTSFFSKKLTNNCLVAGVSVWFLLQPKFWLRLCILCRLYSHAILRCHTMSTVPYYAYYDILWLLYYTKLQCLLCNRMMPTERYYTYCTMIKQLCATLPYYAYYDIMLRLQNYTIPSVPY